MHHQSPTVQISRLRVSSPFPPSKQTSLLVLHVLYGMNKDHVAGRIRLGYQYTKNADLRKAMGIISMFHWSGKRMGRPAIAMLEDETWMCDFWMSSRVKLGGKIKR